MALRRKAKADLILPRPTILFGRVFQGTMDLTYKKGVIERYIRAYNDLDIEGMIAWMHPDCSFENRSGGR